MLKPFCIAAFAGGALVLAIAAHAQPAPPSADIKANDYGDEANWLCWPGRADACASDLTPRRSTSG